MIVIMFISSKFPFMLRNGFVLGHLFLWHLASAAVACVTARQAIRHENLVDDFRAEYFNQTAEFLDQWAVFFIHCITLYLESLRCR